MTQLLLIGLFFAIIGLCTLVFSKQKKLTGILPLIIGLAAIFLTTLGPLSNSQEHISKILKLDSNEVVKITISPTKHKGSEEISLTKNIIEITDRKKIDSLCLALAHAKETSALIKNPSWICLMEVKKKDGSLLLMQVRKAGSSTLIEVNSNGDYGWKYGNLDAAYLGQLLVDMLKQEAGNPVK